MADGEGSDSAARARTGAASVLVGVDASIGSITALKWAAAYAFLNDAALRVMFVWRWSPDPERDQWTDGGEERARAELSAIIATALGDPLEGSATVERRLVESGHAGEALVGAAKDASLLVVGRHNPQGNDVAVLGATSRYVTTHAPCPVVVVPSPDGGRSASDVRFLVPQPRLRAGPKARQDRTSSGATTPRDGAS